MKPVREQAFFGHRSSFVAFCCAAMLRRGFSRDVFETESENANEKTPSLTAKAPNDSETEAQNNNRITCMDFGECHCSEFPAINVTGRAAKARGRRDCA